MGAWNSRERELQRELDAVKKVNEQLLEEIRHNREQRLAVAGGQRTIKGVNISRERVLAWVDDQLSKPDSNIGWMPDVVERKLKTDIFVMLLGLVEHLLETTKIEVMGHEISFELEPQEVHDEQNTGNQS